MRKRIVNILAATLLAGPFFSSCSDLLDGVDTSVVVEEDVNTKSMLLGIYSYMTQPSVGVLHSDFGWLSIGVMGDVMTDDVALHTLGAGMYTFDYALDYWRENHARAYQCWLFFSTIINNSNSIISILPANTPDIEQRAILGQAHALRGFAMFYMSQLFQQTYVGNEDKPAIPVIISLKEGESIYGRAPLRTVFERVDSDFKLALNLLEGWKRPNNTYIDKSVASGLYARVCLVKNDWENAGAYAKQARELSETRLFTAAEIAAEGFNDISAKEWMWGADITPSTSTMFASLMSFLCPWEIGYGGAGGNYHKIDAQLHSQMGAQDARQALFKDPKKSYSGAEMVFPAYTNLKFKKVANWAADYVYMRHAEMILIEAEALAQRQRYADAGTVLKQLMSQRDPAWSMNYANVDEVYKQRRLELWGEGFALFDHLRLRKGIDRTYSGTNHYEPRRFRVEAGSWLFLMQVPLREINNNAYINAEDQNPVPSESEKITN